MFGFDFMNSVFPVIFTVVFVGIFIMFIVTAVRGIAVGTRITTPRA